jgi:hypothetical protein
MRFVIYRKGKVRLTVVSKCGKEAIVGILNESDFFVGGQGSSPSVFRNRND